MFLFVGMLVFLPKRATWLVAQMACRCAQLHHAVCCRLGLGVLKMKQIDWNGKGVLEASKTVNASGIDLATLSHNAYITLRDQIVTMEIEPGALLSENSLGASLGLSRTPIREALKRLEREYLVSILPRRGIVVTEVDQKSQLQLIEMRRGLEVRVIVRGSQRATPEQRLKLGRLAEEMTACAATSDLVGYFRLDSEFDSIIDKAADNRFLTDAMKPVHALVRRFWYTQKDTEGLQEALVQHARIVRAAANGDVPQALDLLNELYDLNEKYILRLLSAA